MNHIVCVGLHISIVLGMLFMSSMQVIYIICHLGCHNFEQVNERIVVI